MSHARSTFDGFRPRANWIPFLYNTNDFVNFYFQLQATHRKYAIKRGIRFEHELPRAEHQFNDRRWRR